MTERHQGGRTALIAAFDVDGTLLLTDLERETQESDFRAYAPHCELVARESVRSQLITLWQCGVKIHVWSGSGESWARHVARQIGIAPYVDSYSHKSGTDLVPDITFDDQPITLGGLNILVPEVW
jgi:hypothetical protein